MVVQSLNDRRKPRKVELTRHNRRKVRMVRVHILMQVMASVARQREMLCDANDAKASPLGCSR